MGKKILVIIRVTFLRESHHQVFPDPDDDFSTGFVNVSVINSSSQGYTLPAK